MHQAQWTPAYVALGSNLAGPEQQVARALLELSRLTNTRLIRQSSAYQSRPMGPQAQPVFINAVAALLTQQTAQQLLSELQRIESLLGRQPASERWGPRIIDLDILMFGDTHCLTDTLQLPHPGMLLRNFVMTPLAEIAPQLVLPNGLLAAQVATQLGTEGLQHVSRFSSL
jgi:2-amino-4-hydroxy-6-hydroxymethyldihydropteridine diphosphokinase